MYQHTCSVSSTSSKGRRRCDQYNDRKKTARRCRRASGNLLATTADTVCASTYCSHRIWPHRCDTADRKSHTGILCALEAYSNNNDWDSQGRLALYTVDLYCGRA